MDPRAVGPKRAQAAPPIYRLLMQALEARRVELGISMATVDEAAGLSSGYFAKMLFPETPSGRRVQLQTLQWAFEALFGRDFELNVSSKTECKHSLLSWDAGQSAKYRGYRHWRHRKHFVDMGAEGGRKRSENLTPIQRTAIARKAGKARVRALKSSGKLSEANTRAANARWQKARQAEAIAAKGIEIAE